MTNVLICSYLEPYFVEKISSVDARLDVHYRPDLLPKPRYIADHVGAPLERSPEQQREWLKLLNEAEVLFDFDYTDPTNLIHHAPNVRWIQTTSSGIGQFIKQHELHQLDVVFTNAAGIHARPLAEFVLWAMLAFAKNYPLARKQQRQAHWQRFFGDEIEGKTLAVVGLGSIGRAIVRLASTLGVHVIGSKRHTDGVDPELLGVSRLYPWTQMKAMLAEADYLCLICPHTEETDGMMDQAMFAAMKPGSVLINIGRGALVQEQALLNALRDGPLQGAVLDVAPQEPLPAEHPLWEMDNVILFPHSASTSQRENERLTELFCDNLKRYLAGESLKNRFDFERLY